jgi:hypothetical protein
MTEMTLTVKDKNKFQLNFVQENDAVLKKSLLQYFSSDMFRNQKKIELVRVWLLLLL